MLLPSQLLPWTCRSNDVDAQLQQSLAALQAVSAQAAAEEEDAHPLAVEIARKVLLHGFPCAQGPPAATATALWTPEANGWPLRETDITAEKPLNEQEEQAEDGPGEVDEGGEARTEEEQERAAAAAERQAGVEAARLRRVGAMWEAEASRRRGVCDELLAALHAPAATSLGERLVGLSVRKVRAYNAPCSRDPPFTGSHPPRRSP